MIEDNKYMAYITGVYMSDGSLSLNNRGYKFRLSSIDNDYILYTEKCFMELLGKGMTHLKPQQPKTSILKSGKPIVGKHDVYSAVICSKDIFFKLKEETKEKEIIPEWILESQDEEIKTYFMSGMIDGDGWICYNINGRGLQWQIGLSGRESALISFSKMCNRMGIKHAGPTKIVASNKTYRIFFDILDILRVKLTLRIKRKNDRIEFIRKILNDYMLVSKTQPKRIASVLGLDEDIVGTSAEMQR